MQPSDACENQSPASCHGNNTITHAALCGYISDARHCWEEHLHRRCSHTRPRRHACIAPFLVCLVQLRPLPPAAQRQHSFPPFWCRAASLSGCSLMLPSSSSDRKLQIQAHFPQCQLPASCRCASLHASPGCLPRARPRCLWLFRAQHARGAYPRCPALPHPPKLPLPRPLPAAAGPRCPAGAQLRDSTGTISLPYGL